MPELDPPAPLLHSIPGELAVRPHPLRTLLGLASASFAVTVMMVAVAGELAADHLSAETAYRWARGDVIENVRSISDRAVARTTGELPVPGRSLPRSTAGARG